jgi:hypothetical protein
MQGWRQVSRFTLVLALAWMPLAGVTGCSRQLALSPPTGTPATSQLPFDRVSDGGGVSPTGTLVFEGLPAGTEITIRLRSGLSSANSRVGDSFEAVLDGSIIIAGKTIVPRGALVTGSVVDSKASAGHDPGYLRMTLASIAMNGRSIPLQTSSIFAKGGSHERRPAEAVNRSRPGGNGTVPSALAGYGAGTGSSSAGTADDVRFSTGHRLTFRLIQPLHL